MGKYIKLNKDEKVKLKNGKLYRITYENDDNCDTEYAITEFYIKFIAVTRSGVLVGGCTRSRTIMEYSVNKQNGKIDYSVIKGIELDKFLETERYDDNVNLISIIGKKYKSKFSQKLHNFGVLIREAIRIMNYIYLSKKGINNKFLL